RLERERGLVGVGVGEFLAALDLTGAHAGRASVLAARQPAAHLRARVSVACFAVGLQQREPARSLLVVVVVRSQIAAGVGVTLAAGAGQQLLTADVVLAQSGAADQLGAEHTAVADLAAIAGLLQQRHHALAFLL